MNIKFIKLDRTEGQSQAGKSWVGYKIVGTKLDNGQEWTSGLIFDNKYSADILSEIRDLTQGDKINVELEQKGKFWNVVGIGPVKDAPSASSESVPSSTKAWGGRSGEAYDRSAAVYLAFEFLKETSTEGTMKSTKLSDLFDVANVINIYIHEGKTQAPSVGGTGDGLEAPQV
jgi:hypothetical protein